MEDQRKHNFSIEAAPERKFALEVDSDHKAKQFKFYSFAAPHMRSFQLAWFSFFCCFVSTFATPPLLPLIRDNLNLTATDIGNAGIASVSGAVFARLAMGTALDLVGPRFATSTVILVTAIPVYFTAIINSAAGFLIARFMAGFSLASFVSTQFWMSSMFSSSTVGLANGVAGGWGNMGGGATQLLMPLLLDAILKMGSTKFTAWRIAFFIPGLMQSCSALAILAFGDDMPDGNYGNLRKSGNMHKDKFGKVFYHAISNYRGWLLAITYGYCFGVELTINNIIANYFYDRFQLHLRTAGLIAAGFGLVNFFSRPAGGWYSDHISKRFGMRGRLWILWIVQTMGGVLCIVLGKMNILSAAVAVMIVFSIFVQAAEGLTFGVVPFVSRRSLGLISGMTGGGGNLGAVLTQLIFFTGTKYSTEDGITYMGMMMIAGTLPVLLIYFPQWGGMLVGPRKGAAEEEYYLSEWTEEEKEKGYHLASMKYAENSRRERGKSGADVITVPLDASP